MLTVSQVADRLGVCKMTVYRRIHEGDLKALKVGGLYRIENKDFETYLKGARTRGSDASGAAGSPKA